MRQTAGEHLLSLLHHPHKSWENPGGSQHLSALYHTLSWHLALSLLCVCLCTAAKLTSKTHKDRESYRFGDREIGGSASK